MLGTDAAGVTADGQRSRRACRPRNRRARGRRSCWPRTFIVFSERGVEGTLAQRLAVPSRNLVPKPPSLSFAEAACLPTAYLTAYRMLFTRAGLRPGQSVLVQGAGGGVATALVLLGRAAGLTVYVTSRSEEKRARALELGATLAFEPGSRLPMRVDAVMETVGRATWDHSLKSLRRRRHARRRGRDDRRRPAGGPGTDCSGASCRWSAPRSARSWSCSGCARSSSRPASSRSSTRSMRSPMPGSRSRRLEAGAEFGKIVVVP